MYKEILGDTINGYAMLGDMSVSECERGVESGADASPAPVYCN